jgi:hypothetical protein
MQAGNSVTTTLIERIAKNNCKNFMKSFAEIDVEKNGDYLKLLSAVSKLSGLFSESAVPFINYRVAENIFCRSFEARNLSRSDTAFRR